MAYQRSPMNHDSRLGQTLSAITDETQACLLLPATRSKIRDGSIMNSR